MHTRVVAVGFGVLFAAVTALAAEELPRDEQIRIIENYLYVSGRLDDSPDLSAALGGHEHESELPYKCGTDAVLEFMSRRHLLDKSLLDQYGADTIFGRPTNLTTDSLDSPSGRFRIHYATSGTHAAYTGIPGYVDSVARIFDEVYNLEVTTLGYPSPPGDSFYTGDNGIIFDVFLINLPSGLYGATYPEIIGVSETGPQGATAHMRLDNDYQSVPGYQARPLDAVRVTAAHEYFHVVQFGIDFFEGGDTTSSVADRYWMEMSAVWMEERAYDNINDYYAYLPFYFDKPSVSLQRFGRTGGVDFHPYASVVFPIFLAETFGADMIKSIWLRSGALGAGPDFFEAAGAAIDSATNSAWDFGDAFQRFAVWNFFTGSRANQAPGGIGYSERIAYPAYRLHPDSGIRNETTYPIGTIKTGRAQHNGAFYLQLAELATLRYDTSGSDIDSVFTFQLSLDPDFTPEWGLSVIYQDEVNPDLYDFDQLRLIDSLGGIGLDFVDPRQYRSIVLVLTPSSSDPDFYSSSTFSDFYEYLIAYRVPTEVNALDSSLIDLPAAVLSPYPNPAVIGRMAEEQIRFKFQVPTDSLSLPIYGEDYSGDPPYLTVDIFTVAGEHVRALTKGTTGVDDDPREGEYWIDWDMKNDGGKQVASGVYIVYGRLFTSPNERSILADLVTKVAIIR